VSPFALSIKSLVYSDKRLLRPMRRVDFDPNGARNPQNRGISGYVPISWDEALDIVCGEIKRMKREHGPGAIALYHSSHHQWGNVGYYLSALARFGNSIGFTRVHLNPDSWEGWYWGAVHHYGNSMRIGPWVRRRGGLPGMRNDGLLVGRPDAVPAPMAARRGTATGVARELGSTSYITPNLTTTPVVRGSGRPTPGRIPPGAAIMQVWI
jgi:trimethylamine-N-oxide reductase (cytochrome c)